MAATRSPGLDGHILELSDIRDAAARLAGVAHRTPVVASRTLDERVGARVHLKAECFQRVGAFKFRGAYNKLASMTPENRARGVVAHSSGNHAQAVALSARLFGTTATIVMPSNAPKGKLEATAGYGAEVVLYDLGAEDPLEICERLAAERGLVFVHPFDDPLVMAGQGTAALELLEDVPDLDTLVVPVSGGGLMAGCATAAAALQPSIRIVGVEPEAANDTQRSLEVGRPVRLDENETIADGLRATQPGDLTFAVNSRLVHSIVTVSDAEIVEAMVFLHERLKLVAEPSGAAATAALLTGRIETQGRRIGVIVSGGNVDMQRLVTLAGAA